MPVSTQIQLAFRQVGYELLALKRNPRRMFFTAGLPLMFLVIFSALYGNDPVDGHGSRGYLTYFVPGILAYGVIASTFTSVAAAITQLRDEGVLKRVRGTPIPSWVYLAGHVGAVACMTAAITAVTLTIASVVYGVSLPWHAMPGIVTAIFVGGAAFTALGFGVVRLVKSSDSGPMIVNMLILPLTFISGIWGQPVDDHTIAKIAGIFPVRMLADALQHAYDPSVSGAAISGRDLLWMGVWAFGGVRLTQRFLRAEAANG